MDNQKNRKMFIEIQIYNRDTMLVNVNDIIQIRPANEGQRTVLILRSIEAAGQSTSIVWDISYEDAKAFLSEWIETPNP